jgi:hypothetical protein
MKTRHAVRGLALVVAGGVLIGQFASAGAAGAAKATGSETVVGAATITGAPRGWEPDNFYTFFCPTGEAFSLSCPGQLSGSPNQSTGRYSTRVPASRWKLGMYYYTANGETMASGPVAIPDRAGATIDRNVSMAYVVPAAQGTVSITGAPADFTNNAYMGVQACPAARAFAVGCAGGQEAYEDVAPGSSYLIDVPRGHWTIADYYRTDDNLHTFAGTPVGFVAVKGTTLDINVTMPYQGLS